MQDGVFNAANVLVNTACTPIVNPLIDHCLRIVWAGIAQEIPGRFHEGIHRVGFTPRRAAAFRASGFVKLRHTRQG